MQQQLFQRENKRNQYSTINSDKNSQNLRQKYYGKVQRRPEIQIQLKKISKMYYAKNNSFLNGESNYGSRLVLPKLNKNYNKEQNNSSISKIQKSFTTNVLSQNSKDNFDFIKINLSNSRYKVTQNVCNQLNFNICYDQDEQEQQTSKWDFKWTDTAPSSEFISKLSKNQRINFFCGISSISRKNQLISNLDKMRQQFKQQYNFYPQTFQFPFQAAKLSKYYKNKINKRQDVIFIVKPQASCQGKGIYLCNSLYDIQSESKCVVQNYISNPMLFDGLKFDLRVYALITNSNPLSIFIYREGLVRLATEKYQYPVQSNFQNLCMHLTNYAINKNSPNYKFNKSVQDLKYGHKQSLAQFFKFIKQRGIDSLQIWSQIKTNIVKTLISVQPHLHYEYRMAQPKNQDCSVCYHVLGFDFMIDQNRKCYLLQVNQTPSYSTQAPIDYLIKSYLIKDTLNIVKNQRKRAMKASKITHKVNLKRNLRNQCSQKEYDLWQILNQEQKNYIGNYERIYPSKYEQTQKQYQKFLLFAKLSYSNSAAQNQKDKKKQTSIFMKNDNFSIKKSRTIDNKERQLQRIKTQASEKKYDKQENNKSFIANILTQARLSNSDRINITHITNNSVKVPINNVKSFIQNRKIIIKNHQIQKRKMENSKIRSLNSEILQRLSKGQNLNLKLQKLYKNPLQNVIEQRQFYEKELQTTSNKQTNANQ